MATVITLEEAAALLGGSGPLWPVRHVRQLARAGHIPLIGKGRSVRTFSEAIKKFLTEAAEGRVTWPPKAKAPYVAPSSMPPLRGKPPKRPSPPKRKPED
jgi:hypothetical protein